jgi:hypothetical protein
MRSAFFRVMTQRIEAIPYRSRKIGPTGSPKTSVRNYRYTLRDNPEERRSQLYPTSKQTYYTSLFTHKSSIRAVYYKLLKITLNKPQRKIQYWGVYIFASSHSLYLIFNEKEYRGNKPCDFSELVFIIRNKWIRFHPDRIQKLTNSHKTATNAYLRVQTSSLF